MAGDSMGMKCLLQRNVRHHGGRVVSSAGRTPLLLNRGACVKESVLFAGLCIVSESRYIQHDFPGLCRRIWYERHASVVFAIVHGRNRSSIAHCSVMRQRPQCRRRTYHNVVYMFPESMRLCLGQVGESKLGYAGKLRVCTMRPWQSVCDQSLAHSLQR